MTEGRGQRAPVKSSFGGLPMAAFNGVNRGQRTEGRGKRRKKNEGRAIKR